MALTFDTPDWLAHKGSLFAGYGVVGSLLLGTHTLFGPFSWPWNVAGLILLAAVWTLVWFRLDVPPPKNTTDRFGIGIFISTESDKARLRLENDLLSRMRETLHAQGLSNLFELIPANNPQAAK